MKIRYFITVCLTLFILFPLYSQTRKLTILHTNDTHSRIEAVDANDARYAGMGGVVSRKAYIESVRKAEKNVLVFDAGDFSQGTPFYNVFKGEVEIECMNRLGYNAGTIGNHEFDYGLDNLKELIEEADFPFVCTNYDFSKTELRKLVKPYVIIKLDGIKVGVIGLGTNPEGLIQLKNYKGMEFIEPYAVAEKTASFLKKRKKCDVVVCLSHLGLDCGALNGYCDRELAAQTKNIDVILGGHSHTYLEKPEYVENADGKEVIIMQNGKNGVFVGRIDINLEKSK